MYFFVFIGIYYLLLWKSIKKLENFAIFIGSFLNAQHKHIYILIFFIF